MGLKYCSLDSCRKPFIDFEGIFEFCSVECEIAFMQLQEQKLKEQKWTTITVQASIGKEILPKYHETLKNNGFKMTHSEILTELFKIITPSKLVKILMERKKYEVIKEEKKEVK